MKLTGIELRRVAMPLVGPFTTSFGTQRVRDVLLVRAVTPDAEGWGECVALSRPLYSPEYVEGAAHVVEHHLAPRLFDAGDLVAADVARVLAPVHGHPMAKAALELAILDARLRTLGVPFGTHLGAVRDRVPCGVSVGITDSDEQLLDAVAAYLDAGYRRIKLKIAPGRDVEPIAAVRERFGDEVPLQVDANASYTLAQTRQLVALDAFDLLCIEQPLAPADIRGHAELAPRLATPICLDESIESARGAADAIMAGACDMVNIKAGRVGGYLEARRIHDVCAAHGVPVWCGGMLETGVGRAANVALAALPNFDLPGDTSASDRYYDQDLVTEPFRLDDGHLTVPTGPGLGVEIDRDVLEDATTAVTMLGPGA